MDWEKHPEYIPKTFTQKLGYLVEEGGEVQSAVGKILRFGLDSVNPLLPPEKQVTNRNWLLAELRDLERAARLMREDIELESLAPDRGRNRTMTELSVYELTQPWGCVKLVHISGPNFKKPNVVLIGDKWYPFKTSGKGSVSGGHGMGNFPAVVGIEIEDNGRKLFISAETLVFAEVEGIS